LYGVTSRNGHALMPRWAPEIALGDRFRPFAKLFEDTENETPDKFPQVIFIEPAYTSEWEPLEHRPGVAPTICLAGLGRCRPAPDAIARFVR
jgi:hypothetical protein